MPRHVELCDDYIASEALHLVRRPDMGSVIVPEVRVVLPACGSSFPHLMILKVEHDWYCYEGWSRTLSMSVGD